VFTVITTGRLYVYRCYRYVCLFVTLYDYRPLRWRSLVTLFTLRSRGVTFVPLRYVLLRCCSILPDRTFIRSPSLHVVRVTRVRYVVAFVRYVVMRCAVATVLPLRLLCVIRSCCAATHCYYRYVTVTFDVYLRLRWLFYGVTYTCYPLLPLRLAMFSRFPCARCSLPTAFALFALPCLRTRSRCCTFVCVVRTRFALPLTHTHGLALCAPRATVAFCVTLRLTLRLPLPLYVIRVV